MNIKTKNIYLIKIRQNHLETIRKMRNSAEIKDYMFYKEKISKKDQKIWFKNISNKNNLYFIIKYGRDYIGVVNLKNINWHNHSGEAGIFIINSVQNSLIPYQAFIKFLDYCFNKLKILTMYGQVVPYNKRAIRFFKSIGFVFNYSNKNKLTCKINKQLYNSKCLPVKQLLKIISN